LSTLKDSYNLNEAADLLGVSRRTLERAIKDGEVNSYKLRYARRIEAEEIERIKKKEQTAPAA